MPSVLIASHTFVRHAGDSTGVQLLRAFSRLPAQGWNVAVVAPHAPGLAPREIIDGLEIHRFRYLWPTRWQSLAYEFMPNLKASWWARLQFPLFMLSFVSTIVRNGRKADVIHVQWSVAGLCALLAAPLIRKPFVVTLRGTDLAIADGNRIYRAFLRTLLRRADAVTGTSEDLVHRAGAIAGRDDIVAVPNGVDLPNDAVLADRSARTDLGIPPDATMVLFVGRLSPVKGTADLIQAFAMAGNQKAWLVLTGDGELRLALESLASATGCAAHVIFTGSVAPCEVPRLLAAADTFVMPSLSEGRPNAVIEAMAYGLPVIATAVGGTPELVEDDETGLLVAASDVPALANALSKVLGDPALRERMGRAGQTKIAELDLTWERTAAMYAAVYDRVRGGD